MGRKESTSEEDNRMGKVQEMLSEKYQKDSFSIYVKQLTTGKRRLVSIKTKKCMRLAS